MVAPSNPFADHEDSYIPMSEASLQDVFAMADVRARLLLRPQKVKITMLGGERYWRVEDTGLKMRY